MLVQRGADWEVLIGWEERALGGCAELKRCLRRSLRITATEPFNCKTVPVKALPSQDRRKDPETLGGWDFA
ncbi:UNVERIFIED_CONTAM: hypothetical protein FKN15_016447 [Acipenser sinensis]